MLIQQLLPQTVECERSRCLNVIRGWQRTTSPQKPRPLYRSVNKALLRRPIAYSSPWPRRENRQDRYTRRGGGRFTEVFRLLARLYSFFIGYCFEISTPEFVVLQNPDYTMHTLSPKLSKLSIATVKFTYCTAGLSVTYLFLNWKMI